MDREKLKHGGFDREEDSTAHTSFIRNAAIYRATLEDWWKQNRRF
jgi:hypothetical protein